MIESNEISREDIARRAYELYLLRGREHGRDVACLTSASDFSIELPISACSSRSSDSDNFRDTVAVIGSGTVRPKRLPAGRRRTANLHYPRALIQEELRGLLERIAVLKPSDLLIPVGICD